MLEPVCRNRTTSGVKVMAPPKILISDKLDPLAVEVFTKNGLAADYRPGLSPEEQLAIIGGYDGLAVRSGDQSHGRDDRCGEKAESDRPRRDRR